MRIRSIPCLTLLVLCLAACGLETEPNPDHHGGDGGAGTTGGTHAGTGGHDAGDDAGGEGGTSGVTGGHSGSGGDAGGMTGGVGGSGGDGGSVACTEDKNCPATRPQCSSEGECTMCSSSAACEEREGLAYCVSAVSSSQRGQCAACLEDEHCEGNDDGEYCNTVSNICVPCKTNADCTDLTKPQCGADGQCTGCTSNEACEGRDGTEACRTAAGPTRGHCVACATDADCTEADAPQCQSNNTCGGCTSEAACEGRTDHEHCNLRDGTETFGECVKCTGATEAAECNGNSCKQSTGECTETTKGSRNACQSCEADSECGGSRKCVAQTIEATTIGTFCFSVAPETGCATAANDDLKPYSRALADVPSVDSTEQQTYCVPPTSCQAYTDATIYMDVAGPKPCTASNECGIHDSEIDGAFCIPNDFVVVGARQRCSYGCETSADCPETGFPNCPTSGVQFCRP